MESSNQREVGILSRKRLTAPKLGTSVNSLSFPRSRPQSSLPSRLFGSPRLSRVTTAIRFTLSTRWLACGSTSNCSSTSISRSHSTRAISTIVTTRQCRARPTPIEERTPFAVARAWDLEQTVELNQADATSECRATWQGIRTSP